MLPIIFKSLPTLPTLPTLSLVITPKCGGLEAHQKINYFDSTNRLRNDSARRLAILLLGSILRVSS